MIAKRTWREVQDGELMRGDQILPTALIFTRKRPCDEFPQGRFKARLVALGNVERWAPGTEPSTYAPVCSYAANRYLTIRAASKRWFLRQLDITLAFVNAELTGLDKSIFVRLPKEWAGPSAEKGATVKLLRALYGLRLSPLLWYRTYRDWLVSQGWYESEKEPGLFQLTIPRSDGEPPDELWLTVYVDDSLIAGSRDELVKEWVDRILEKFPGRELPAAREEREVDGERRLVDKRDILGADLYYCQESGWTCWSMESAIQRALKSHDMQDERGSSRITTPCEVHADLTQGALQPTYPIRQVVGSLLYIATVGRPDALFAATKLARHSVNCTKSVVTAAKRLLKYLRNTASEGLVYSPERHKLFNKKSTRAC